MKQKHIFLGIDVSKSTLDICLISDENTTNFTIKNCEKRIRSFFLKIYRQNAGARLKVCVENTGYYNWPCYEAIRMLEGIDIYVVNPFHLKRSLGLVRGKNDAIDARRIADFISLRHTQIKPTVIPRDQIRQIQALLAFRNRLVSTKAKFSVPSAELSLLADKSIKADVLKGSKSIVNVLEKQIKSIEAEILKIIDMDQELKEKYHYMVSVQGVGKVLAWTMLVKTNEFKSINNPRKLACYSGVVPFEFQSGSSILKRPRVSTMADKTLKKLLHMAAMRAIQLNGDMQDYYIRKVSEGKNKMLVLNAVRNKIVARICSVVNNKKNYQNNLTLS